MIAAVVDTGALLTVIVASVIAGVGVSAAFGLAILGSIRAVESGREGRTGPATLFGAVGLVGALTVLAAIVFGIVVLAD